MEKQVYHRPSKIVLRTDVIKENQQTESAQSNLNNFSIYKFKRMYHVTL